MRRGFLALAICGAALLHLQAFAQTETQDRPADNAALNTIVRDEAAAPQHDCRMDPTALRPVVAYDNPFAAQHTWDDALKHETLQLDAHRLVVIEQRACLRHHIDITIVVAPPATRITEPEFLLNELLQCLDKIFYNDLNYYHYKNDMRAHLAALYRRHGPGQRINFPVADRTFIAAFEHGGMGAVLRMEIVTLLHTHQIKLPGIPEKQDDGWRNPQTIVKKN
jgi:hypothetical protein